MILLSHQIKPNYFVLHQKVKPIYAYYSILTHLVNKCEQQAVIFGKTEIELLIDLAQKVIDLTTQMRSFHKGFRLAEIYENHRLLEMTPLQRWAKNRLIIINNLAYFDQSAMHFGYILQHRLQIINAISQEHFALPIPPTQIKVCYETLFSPYSSSKIKILGAGTFGRIEQVVCMGQMCAKKTFLKKWDHLLHEAYEGASITIQVASPSICDFYYFSDRSFYSECGSYNAQRVFQTDKARDFILNLSKYVEDLLKAFSMLHFGTGAIIQVISKDNSYCLTEGSPPAVHGDFKPTNCLLVGNTLKLIDMDTTWYAGSTISEISTTFEFISPDAASIYKNPHGFKRKISIYDDSWSLGCSLYKILFASNIYHRGDLTDQNEIMEQIASITQEMIDAKLENLAEDEIIFYLGTKDTQACLDYFNETFPSRLLSRAQIDKLQSRLGLRELKRLIGIMKGLLTVDVRHRLTIDQAHNIYYMAERKLRSIHELNFDNPISHMGVELNLLHTSIPFVSLKIESQVRLIQKLYRKHLIYKRAHA